MNDDDRSVESYIASLDEQTARDSEILVEMMRRISRRHKSGAEATARRVHAGAPSLRLLRCGRSVAS